MPRIIELPNFRYPTSLLEDKAFAANPEVSIQTDILDSFAAHHGRQKAEVRSPR